VKKLKAFGLSILSNMLKVKKYKWNSGALSVVETLFETMHEAHNSLRYSNHHAVKIYDENNNLVHSAGNVPEETYA